MWTLILVTLLSTDPPRYYYNPIMILNTLAECEEMANAVRKTESGKPVRIICSRTGT